jgi:hypothetical protein
VVTALIIRRVVVVSGLPGTATEKAKPTASTRALRACVLLSNASLTKENPMRQSQTQVVEKEIQAREEDNYGSMLQRVCVQQFF